MSRWREGGKPGMKFLFIALFAGNGLLAAPAVAGINLQCRMTDFCANGFECQKMDVTVAFVSDGPAGANQQGEGQIVVDGAPLPARYRIDANGVLIARVIPDPGGDDKVVRLIASGDGLGVFSSFVPLNKLSVLQYGVCRGE
jgi:hypothetical protein